MIKMAKMKPGGFTLLELTVALGLWMLLIAGVSMVLTHSTRAAASMLARQEAAENARVAMDALTVNIQMADVIDLRTDPDGMLRSLRLRQVGPQQGRIETYQFNYDGDLSPYHVRYNRLHFGRGGNELASHLSEIRLTLSANREILYINIVTCENLSEPITLTRAVDIRYKSLIIR